MTDRAARRSSDERSVPELDFAQRWRPLIDQVGGDGGQKAAAKHLNWTTSTVSRDYTGDTLPTDERLHQLCSALRLTPDVTLELLAALGRARTARKARLRDHGPCPGTEAGHSAEAKALTEAAANAPDQERTAPEQHRSGLVRLLSAGFRGSGRFVGSTAIIAIVLVVTAVMVTLSATTSTGARVAGVSPQPTASGTFPALTLDVIQIPVDSLSPGLARAFGQGRTAHAATIAGFVFRNSKDTALCLAASDSSPVAGQNRDPVVVSDCGTGPNQVWIPEQWEINGSRSTRLINEQYQTKCMNADNIGGLQNGHIVQLWDCYPAANESWDFGDWHRATGASHRSYPLFVQSGRLCLDADKYDLRDGTAVRIWTQYASANQFWS